MKTVEEWAEELPKDVRERFLANVAKQKGEKAFRWKHSSLSGAILGSFVWRKSLGGDDFWIKIYNQLKSENR